MCPTKAVLTKGMCNLVTERPKKRCWTNVKTLRMTLSSHVVKDGCSPCSTDVLPFLPVVKDGVLFFKCCSSFEFKGMSGHCLPFPDGCFVSLWQLYWGFPCFASGWFGLFLGSALMAESMVCWFRNSLKTKLIEDFLVSLFVVVGLLTLLFGALLGIW